MKWIFSVHIHFRIMQMLIGICLCFSLGFCCELTYIGLYCDNEVHFKNADWSGLKNVINLSIKNSQFQEFECNFPPHLVRFSTVNSTVASQPLCEYLKNTCPQKVDKLKEVACTQKIATKKGPKKTKKKEKAPQTAQQSPWNQATVGICVTGAVCIMFIFAICCARLCKDIWKDTKCCKKFA
jgi:hypothetical protein